MLLLQLVSSSGDNCEGDDGDDDGDDGDDDDGDDNDADIGGDNDDNDDDDGGTCRALLADHANVVSLIFAGVASNIVPCDGCYEDVRMILMMLLLVVMNVYHI